MRASKIALLVVILLSGAAVETAWSVRHHISLAPWGIRILSGRFYGPSFPYEAEEHKDVSAQTPVEIWNAFGSVSVSPGAPGQVRVRIRKVVFLQSEEQARTFASKIRLDLSLTGSTLSVSTNREEIERGDDTGFETHLSVEVPPGTSVKVRNDHGSVDVHDVAEASVSNSHDRVRVDKVAGNADLKTSHGKVEAYSIEGKLSLTSGHGDIQIHDVAGQVDVVANHGDVSLARVGAAQVQLHFGDLTVEDCRGNIEFRGDHAGAQLTKIGGDVRARTSFRAIRAEGVAGSAWLRAEHGNVFGKQVRGALKAEASYHDIELTTIGGLCEVKVDHGGLRGEGFEKGARITASGNDVVLDGFSGPIEIDARRGNVRLTPEGALVEPVSVMTTNGGVQLDVPPGSHFDLEAGARRGEVEVSVPGLVFFDSGRSRVTGRLGSGGSAVKLLTDRGDVRLTARRTAASQ